MMRFLTLAEIKMHCRIDTENLEDEYLKMLGEVAENCVEDEINRNLYNVTDTLPAIDSTGMVIKKRHRLAMLLMVGQLYENREATSDKTIKEVPLAYKNLIESDRVIRIL